MADFIESFRMQIEWDYLFIIIIRFILATVLCGSIGYEREHSGRPAGFRTHILVGVGSCLVMLISEYVFLQYQGLTNLDPARLGAQVISGVGFLGAGTIIRDGSTVKGLTTAASLWAVSCIGLACGIGFYSGAVVGTAVTIATLMFFKKIEKNASLKHPSNQNAMVIDIKRDGHDVLEIVRLLETFGVHAQKIEMLDAEDAGLMRVRVLTKTISPLLKAEITNALMQNQFIVRQVNSDNG